MSDAEGGRSESLKDAMGTWTDANRRVTVLLTRMAAGEGVEAPEIEEARDAELLALSRYLFQVVGLVITKVEDEPRAAAGNARGNERTRLTFATLRRRTRRPRSLSLR